MGLRRRGTAATAERVLGTDNRFYSPKKNPEKHKREVAELTRRNKIHKLAEIEKEMDDLTEELKDVKFTLDEEMKLTEQLRIENRRLLVRLDAISAGDKELPVATVVEAPKVVDPEAEAEKAEILANLNDVDDEPTEVDNSSIIEEARAGGKGVSSGELPVFEEHVTGSEAPEAGSNSATA